MHTEETILIIDDEPNIRESLAKVLNRESYRTVTAATANEALALLDRENIDLVLSDLMMPEIDGIALLKQVKARYPDIEFLLITGHASVERAVEAMREGAYDFITKPFKRTDILPRIEKALEKRQLSSENRRLKTQLDQSRPPMPRLIGESTQIQTIRRLIEQIAPMPSTVLITGESGTGKEIIAKQLHALSPRAKHLFVAVNCGAISENIIESELFGHVRGAFTGAVSDKEGLFKAADHGTLFLDEIGALSMNLQVKLLRILEERQVRPVGGTRPQPVDVRIVAACNRDLIEEVNANRFREDLYYRLNVITINSPPLRKIHEDIPHLVQHFISCFNRDLNKNVAEISDETLRRLLANEWRGNVRELRNTIEHAMILCTGNRIEMTDLPLRYHGGSLPGAPSEAVDLKTAVTQFERIHIRHILSMAGGDKKKAARMLALSLSSLYRKMNDLGISNH